MAGWAPLLHLPMRACLPRSGVPCDSPHEGQSMWDSASITLGAVHYFILFYFISCLSLTPARVMTSVPLLSCRSCGLLWNHPQQSSKDFCSGPSWAGRLHWKPHSYAPRTWRSSSGLAMLCAIVMLNCGLERFHQCMPHLQVCSELGSCGGER